MLPDSFKRFSLTNWSLLAWALGCLLFALSVLLPYQAGDWTSFYKQMVGVFGLVFWVLAVHPRRWHGFSFFMIFLMLVVVVQYAAGLINLHDDALLSIAYLFMLLLAFEVGAALRWDAELDLATSDTPTRFGGFFALFWWTLIVVSLLSAVIAFQQWLGDINHTFEFPLVGDRPYGNLAQPNHLASLLLVCICGILYLQQRRALASWLGSVLTCVLLMAVALTVSRVAWVFAIVALIYLNWEIWRGNLRLPRWAPWLFVAFFVACIFATEYFTHRMDLSQIPLAGRLDGEQMNRLRIWGGLLSAVIHGPWYGYGWMQVTSAALASTTTQYGEYFNFSHDLIMDLLVWMGAWLGLAVIVWAVVWLCHQQARPKQTGDVAGWLAVGALLLHSLVEYPYGFVYLLVPGGLILGWLVGKGQSLAAVSDKRGWVALVCAAVLLLGAIVVTREYGLLVTNDFHDRMRKAHIEGFAQIDLNQVVLLDSLKYRALIRRFPAEGALDARQHHLLERVTSRVPTWSSLERLEKDYVVRKDVVGVCRTLDAITKLYDQRTVAAARQTAITLVSSAQCPAVLLQSKTVAPVRYPMIF